jgi:hypothetical protein
MSDWDFGGAYADTAKKMQDLSQSAEKHPLDLEHTRATTRYNNAVAGQMEHKVSAEKELARIMSGVALDTTQPASVNIMRLGAAAMQAGDGDTAKEFLLRASQAQTTEAQQGLAKTRAARVEAEAKIKQSDWYAEKVTGVGSQEDLDALNQTFEALYGEKAPAMQYSPRLVKVLREGSLKMADRLRQEHNIVMEDVAKQRVTNTAAYRGELLKIRQAELDRRKLRDSADKKEGGKDVGSPSTVEQRAATALLDGDPRSKGLDTNAKTRAAFELASRAKALRKSNPGLSASEAMGRTYTELVEEGFFALEKSWLPFSKGKPTFGKPGGAPHQAIALPSDPSARKPNTYYQTPKGVFLYLGDGKWKAPAAASAGAGADLEDEDDDDAED